MTDAPNSDVSVASTAMTLLGLDPISSFSGSPNAAKAGRLYPVVINSLISQYPWGFATVRSSSVARQTAAPAGGFLYAFTLPNPRIGDPEAYFDTDDEGAEPFIGWERSGNAVLADITAMWCVYKRNPGEAYWPGYFMELAINALAARFAMPMTTDKSLFEAYTKIAFGTPEEQGQGGMWRAATFADARTQRVQALPESAFPLVTVRAS